MDRVLSACPFAVKTTLFRTGFKRACARLLSPGIGWALDGLPGTVFFDINQFGDDYLGVTAQSQYMREKTAPRKKTMHGREKTVWPMVLAVGASVCGAGGKHESGRCQLRPNARPILWAEHLSGDRPVRFALDQDAKLGACFPTLRQDLIKVCVVDPAALRKDRTLLGCEVHGMRSYSVTLQDATAKRYRLSDG